jgi:ABC-2 type transport system permease protein
MEGDMSARLLDYIRLVAAYTRANLKAQLEYRGAFLSQVIGMFINNGAWLVFWLFFFTRFPVLGGWGFVDILTLWAVVAAGFGIAFAVMGNALQLASVIVQGDLDIWLSHPRAVLPHILMGKSIPSAWGDAIFGYAVYFAFVRPDAAEMALFALLTFIVALAFIGFGVMAGSLSFYLGNAGAFADEWRNAVVTFATYPPPLFEGVVKLILYTLIPAGFVSYLPAASLRSPSIEHLMLSVAGAAGLVAAGTFVFYRGLRRYESGNLMSMNG